MECTAGMIITFDHISDIRDATFACSINHSLPECARTMSLYAMRSP